MTDKTFLVTGANTGIGRATALALAESGGRVHLAGRSRAKLDPVADEITSKFGPGRAAVLVLDLGDFDSVRNAASAFLARDEPLHVLVNNAGVAGQRGFTASGFELAFGINHLGHFLLTTLLLDRLLESGPARVVTVSSGSHFQAKGIDYGAVRRPTKSMTGLPEYAVSKLANVLFSQELARRVDGDRLTTYSLHPGVIASDIWRRAPWPVRPAMKLFMRSTEQGARTSVYCSTSPELADQTGRYYDNCREKAASKVATPELGAELWAKSDEFVAAASS